MPPNALLQNTFAMRLEIAEKSVKNTVAHKVDEKNEEENV